MYRAIDCRGWLQDDRRDTRARLCMQICGRISADGHYASKYDGAAGTSDMARQSVGNMGKQLGNARRLRRERSKGFGRAEISTFYVLRSRQVHAHRQRENRKFSPTKRSAFRGLEPNDQLITTNWSNSIFVNFLIVFYWNLFDGEIRIRKWKNVQNACNKCRKYSICYNV